MLPVPAPDGFASGVCGVVSGIVPGWAAVPEPDGTVDGEPMLPGVVSVPVAPD
jgi:hypothetical protein